MTHRPESEADLVEIVRAATGPLRIVGGGTRGVDCVGQAVSTAGLSGVRLYEPGAMTIVVGAGTSLAEIETFLVAEGQRFAFEPGDWRGLVGRDGTPTIGGVVAGNISGPRRVQAGACRDAVLGVRFVDGTGAVVKNGGRVMKNVTGYDLAKLLTGSWGTLGVITEVSLKVLPIAAEAASLCVSVASVAQAVAAMSAALGAPYDVTGAAYLPGRGVMIRIEGMAGSVDYRAGKLRDILAGFGAVAVDRVSDSIAADWCAIRDVAPFHGRAGDVWRVSVRPSDAPEVAARLGAEMMFDWGGGLIWALQPQGTDLRALIGGINGHATLVRAAPDTTARLGRFQPEPAAVAALSAGLRALFDPRGILNQGVMA